jgi:hypothetical protein
MEHPEENLSHERYPLVAIDNDARTTGPLDEPRSSHHNARQTLQPPTTTIPPHNALEPALGKPTAKKYVHILDIMAIVLSFLCLTLAVAVVANENTSWQLGVHNQQLVVLGFLLSVMNMCLSSVAPVLFLLLEARYGSSKLQNYDAILRDQVLGSRLSIAWRLVLGLMIALPVGLSAAYKGFQGGQSARSFNPTTRITNASYYGMFAPPGVQGLGQKTGISLFYNATLPFMVASAPTNGSDPKVPDHTQAYGFNILLLNSESTAMLDVPQPHYISSIQSLLAPGESWNITANVIATVAAFNQTKQTDPAGYGKIFDEFCSAAVKSSGAYAHTSMMNEMSVVLLSPVSYSNQSLQYVGLAPDPGINLEVPCDDFYNVARLYDITRQLCEGTWSVTRGGIELIGGSCDGILASPTRQLPVSRNTLFLPVWYMSSLAEFLGPFGTTRNQSAWQGPTMSTSIAAMLWSRITILNSAENLRESDPLPLSVIQRQRDSGEDLTFEEVGMLYPVDDQVLYIRPTVRKSAWLYCVLALQPVLTTLIVGLNSLHYSTPIDRGFGLISILSGFSTKRSENLTGAALSGELVEDIKLVIRPTSKEISHSIEYLLEPKSAGSKNGQIARGVVYY